MSTNSQSKMTRYGKLSALMKDNLYFVGPGGTIYTTPYVSVVEPVSRPTAMILLTARRAPFEIGVNGGSQHHQAVVARPMVAHTRHADNARLVVFHIYPSHPDFPRFRTIRHPGLMPFRRDLFQRFDDRLDAAYGGKLSVEEATSLFRDVVASVVPYLPRGKPFDRRVLRVVELLKQNHNCAVHELAAAVDLSYHRLSHLFAESMGLPLRKFQLWMKTEKAASLIGTNLRLTAIAHAAGFADSAHMCRTFQQLHSAPPSYFLNSDHVNIHSPATTIEAAEAARSAAG